MMLYLLLRDITRKFDNRVFGKEPENSKWDLKSEIISAIPLKVKIFPLKVRFLFHHEKQQRNFKMIELLSNWQTCLQRSKLEHFIPC